MFFAYPYLLYFLTIGFLGFFPILKTKNLELQHNLFSTTTFFILLLSVFFLGFRNFISTDVYGYYRFFLRIPTFSENGIDFLMNKRNGWEFGFCFYTMLCKSIINDFYVYQFFLVVIDYFLLYKSFKYHLTGREVLIAFAVFFVFQGFGIERNLFRNCKAMYIFLLALKYIDEKQFFKYLFAIILAFLFHSSAILYLPLYFILNKKLKPKYIIVIFILGHVFFWLGISWTQIILFPIEKMGIGRISQYVALYGKSYDAYGISIGYLERLLSSLVMIYFYEPLSENRKNVKLLNLFFIFQFIYLYFSDIAIIPQRVALLFIPAYWYLYPQVYSYLKKDFKLLFIGLFFFYALIRIYKESCSPLFLYQNYLLDYTKLRSFDEFKEILKSQS